MLTAKTKILVVTTSFPLTPQSSSGIFVKELKDALSAYHDQTEVLCPESNEESNATTTDIHLSRYAPVQKWQILAHGPGGIPSQLRENKLSWLLAIFLIASMTLNSIRLTKRGDWILANWSISGLISLPAKLLGRKLITVLRGSDVHGLSGLSKIVLRIIVPISNHVVCVSESFHILLRQTFPKYADKIHYIPNGVNDVFLRIAEQKSLIAETNPQPIKILYVGNLIKSKRTDLLLESATTLLQEGIENFNIYICGNGPELNNLRQQTKNAHLEDKVVFLGAVDRNRIIKQLLDSDLFVFPSEKEGRPNALLEAMSAGLTCICARIPPTEELINHEDNGLLFTAGSQPELVCLIRKAINSSELRTHLGGRAHQSIKDLGQTWGDSAEKYFNLMRQ